MSAAHTMLAAASAEERLIELEAEVANLRRALESRTVIGQATGILIAGEGFTAEQAFQVLCRASQRENRKVVDLAAQIVARAVRNGQRGQSQ